MPKPKKKDKIKVSKKGKGRRLVTVEMHEHEKRFPEYFEFAIDSVEPEITDGMSEEEVQAATEAAKTNEVDKIDRLVKKCKNHHKKYVKRLKARKKIAMKVRGDGEEVYLSDVRIKMLREDYVRVIATAAVSVGGARPDAVKHKTFSYTSIDDVPSDDEFAAILLEEIEAEEQEQVDDEEQREEIETRVKDKNRTGGD